MTSFKSVATYHIRCDTDETAWLCKYSGTAWTHVARCSQAGHEAITTTGLNGQERRRRGLGSGGNNEKPDNAPPNHVLGTVVESGGEQLLVWDAELDL